MHVVAYGRNEVLGVVRAEYVHPTLLSVAAQQVQACIVLVWSGLAWREAH
jgi:hypothetical protein